MAQRSTVAQLPAELLDELHAQIRDGRLSIDDLTTFLHERGAAVSRSAVGRYAKSYAEKLESLMRARQVADSWGQRLGDDPADKVGQLVQQLITAAAFNVLVEDDEGRASPDDLGVLARAIKDVAMARAKTDDLEQRITARVQREAAATVEKVAREKGLGGDTVAAIKREILGVR